MFYALVKTPQAVLDGMDAWCQDTHGRSGLLADLARGPAYDIETIDNGVYDFIRRNFSGQPKVHIAGSSVHFDFKFLDVHMPKTFAALDYHLLDVSVFTLMCQTYRKDWVYNEPGREVTHRVVEDIRYSMRLMQWFMDCIGVRSLSPTHLEE